MTDADYGTFARAFGRVSCAFRLKIKPDELDELTRTYFKILEAAPLDDVLAAGKHVLATSRTFPKAAEWLHALPVQPVPVPDDVRVMGTAERLEYVRAEALRYRDDPCACVECVAAHVDDRPLRFVPDDDERAVDLDRNRIVTPGHWAHGDALANWYRARDAFFATVPRHSRIARALLVLVAREPGEEG